MQRPHDARSFLATLSTASAKQADWASLGGVPTTSSRKARNSAWSSPAAPATRLAKVPRPPGVDLLPPDVQDVGEALLQLHARVDDVAFVLEGGLDEVPAVSLEVRPGQEVGHRPLDASHVPPLPEGDRLHARAPAIHLDEEGGLLLTRLGERVLEERAGVANASRHLLRTVQVAEGDVVVAGEGGDRDGPCRTHGDGALAVRGLHRPLDEGMGDEHGGQVAGVRVRAGGGQDALGGRGVAAERVVSGHPADDVGIDEGHRVDEPLPGNDHRLRDLVQGSAEVNAAGLEEPGSEGEPLRGVVVSGDGDDRDAERRHAAEHVVEKLHGLLRGHCPVVDVAGDDEHVRPGIPEGLEEAVEDPDLVGLERLLEEGSAEVPVGTVEDAERHGKGSLRCGRTREVAGLGMSVRLVL